MPPGTLTTGANGVQSMAPIWPVALALPAGAIAFLAEDSQALIDLGTVGRWLEYAGLLLVFGAAGWLLTTRRAVTAPEGVYRALLVSVRGAAVAGGIVLVVAALIRLQAQVLAFRFPGDPVTLASYRDIIGTAWGRGWSVQLGVALLIGVGASFARPATRVWGVAVVAGPALLAIATSLTGHAVGGGRSPLLTVPLHAIHVAGGATWLGTLLLLMVAGFGVTRHLAEAERETIRARLVEAFSPLALAGVSAAVLAGLVLSFLYVGSIPALWQTTYGRLLLAKVVSLMGAGGLGAYNWRRLRPRLGSAGASGALRRSASWELFFGVLLLAATAMLVAQPMGG